MASEARPVNVSVSMSSERTAVSRRLVLAVGVAVALGVYAGWRAWEHSRPYEWSGTVEARTIAVGSRVGGRVKSVLAREGDRVSEGQPLVELEPGDWPAQRLIAQGQLDEARANLARLERGARPEEIEQAKARAQSAVAALKETRAGARAEQIAAAQAREIAAEASAEKATLDADRARHLFETQSIPQGQRDDAEAAKKGAIAQRDAAQHELDELKNGSRAEDVDQAAARASEARASAQLVQAGSRTEDIQAARAIVVAAQGRLDQVDVSLAELVIRSPKAAQVESLDLRPGDIVAPSATAVSLVEDDQLYVRIYVPETQMGFIHLGQRAPVTVDSFPGRVFEGAVEHINAVGEYSPRNLQTADERADQVFAARIGLRAQHDDLRAGMAALIHVPK